MSELLKGLKTIKKQALGGYVEHSSSGICFNLGSMLNWKCKSDAFIQHNCHSWEHFNGNAWYPIDGKDFYENYTIHKWSGEPLEKRLSLIDHLIGVLEGSDE